MAWFVFHALLISVFSGLTARADLFRPARLSWAAEPPRQAIAADVRGIETGPKDPGRRAAGPKKISEDSLGVRLTAPAAALVDADSGAVLFSQGQDRVVPIASITKLMTAMVLLDADPDWEQPVAIAAEDQDKGGMPYLKTGDAMTLRDVFLTTLVGSANNGALALARSTGLTREQFVAKMNAAARALGLFHTRFADPSGYEPGNVSTAFDVARLAHFALERPEILDALTRKEYRFKTAAGAERLAPTTNALLASFLNEGEYVVVGGKTGYTEEAGYTLVMRARHGNADAIGVVLGSKTSEDRFQDLKSLLSWGFRNFDWSGT